MSDSLQPHELQPARLLVHGIFQARILEWVAISFSRGSSWPRDWTHISCIGRQVFYHWATREAYVSRTVPHVLLKLYQWILTTPEILLFLFYRWGIRKQAACSRSYLLEFIKWPTSVLFKSQFTCHFLQEICPHDKNAAYYLFFVL